MSGYSDFVRDRAEEILQRTEMSPEEIAEHEARSRRNRALAASATWDPANPRKLTVATMTVAEYSAYCDAGRPPLEPSAASLPATVEKRTTDHASVTRSALEKRLDAERKGVARGRVRVR